MFPDPLLPAAWHGLLDDCSLLTGDSGTVAAAVRERQATGSGGLVGSLVVTDGLLATLAAVVPDTAERDAIPVTLLVTGGAGAIVPALRLARRHDLSVRRVQTSLRDLDDLAGNARRVVAAVDTARAEGLLVDAPVHLELPAADPTAGWLRAADEAAAAELGLAFRSGGPGPAPSPAEVAGWIDAALDRETRFTCTGGLARAATYLDPDGLRRYGLVNLVLATAELFGGVPRSDAVASLGEPYLELPAAETVVAARRWLTGVASDAVDAVRTSLA